MVIVARDLARQQGIAKSGYRLIINCNPDSGQEVYHLHLHLLGGRPLGSAWCSAHEFYRRDRGDEEKKERAVTKRSAPSRGVRWPSPNGRCQIRAVHGRHEAVRHASGPPRVRRFPHAARETPRPAAQRRELYPAARTRTPEAICGYRRSTKSTTRNAGIRPAKRRCSCTAARARVPTNGRGNSSIRTIIASSCSTSAAAAAAARAPA